MAVEHLVLHRPEERLHYPVVEAVALPGHRLPYPLGREPLPVLPHLVLPPLVGMEYQPPDLRVGLEGPVEHSDGLGEIGRLAEVIGDDQAVEHVLYRR